MSKTPKVVPIKDDVCKTIAEDQTEHTKRFILGIGKRRIAFDFTTKISDLQPGTGDQPARILPLATKTGERSE